MPRTRSLAYSELKIGILSVAALVIAATVVFMLSGQGGFFWQQYHLKTRFPDVPGLKPGAPVRVAGVEVGSVTRIDFVGAQVEVTVRLPRAMQPRVRTHSTASLGTMGLLGQGTVDISASLAGELIPEWGYIPSGRAPGQISDVAYAAAKGFDEAALLLQDIRRGKGTVGKLFTDDALYRDVQAFVDAAEAVATNLKQGGGTIGKLATDETVYRSLQSSLENFNAMIRRLNAGEGSLGRLINDDKVSTSLTSATANLDALSQKLNRGDGTAGKLINDAVLYNRVNSVAERLDQVIARLGQGQGTAGQLLQDKQLYENMNGAASELRALVGDIRKNPRKFLNVKVSIF